MSSGRVSSPRGLIVAAVVVLQVAVGLVLVWSGPGDRPHGAPLRIVAPPVVAQALVDDANGLAGGPVVAVALESERAARTSVRDGTSVAAVVVDLAQEQDILYVASANGSDLNAAVHAIVARTERSFGRSVVVTDAGRQPTTHQDRSEIYMIVGLAVLAGFAIAVVTTWRRGPTEPKFSGGLARLAVAAASASVLGGAGGGLVTHRVGGPFVAGSIVVAMIILATTMVTFALESLLGAGGIGVATSVFILSAAPLAGANHLLLLDQPWRAITPWLPHGAGLEGANAVAFFGGHGIARPTAILAVWLAVAVLVIVVARREERREALATQLRRH